MSKLKSMAIALTILSLVTTLPAEAGRVGSNSKSSSKATTTYNAGNAKRSGDMSSRVGGGKSSGLSRQDTLAQARADRQARLDREAQSRQRQAPSQTRDYYAGNGQSAPQPQPAQQPRRGYSGAQLAGAAAAGAVVGGLVGYATGKDDHPHPSAPAQPYPSPNPNQYAAPAPGYTAPAPSSSYAGPDEHRQPSSLSNTSRTTDSGGSSGFGILLLLLLLGLGAYGVLRLVRSQQPGQNSSFEKQAAGNGDGTAYAKDYSHAAPNRPSSSSSLPAAPASASVFTAEGQMASDELLKSAIPIFRDLQVAQSNGDSKKARQLADGQLLSDVESAIREGSSPVHVHSVEIEGNCVRDFVSENGNYVASIYFVAEISENGGNIETVEELWNFRRPVAGGDWKAVGIDQI